MLRGTQRTLTGVQTLVPRFWPGYYQYPGIRTTLGQHCTAECRLAPRDVFSPTAIGIFVVVEHDSSDFAFCGVVVLSCSSSPLCRMLLVLYFASIGIWMFVFSPRLRTWMAPRSSARGTVCLPGTWPPKKPMRCSSKEVSLRICIEKVSTSKCDLSHSFGSVTAASRSVRGYQQFAVGTLIETIAFPHSGLSTSFESNTSRGNKPRANKNLICVPKFLRHCPKVLGFLHVCV